MNLPVIKILILVVTLSTTYANSPLIADVTLLDGDVYVEGVMSLYSPFNGDCGDQIDPEVVQNLESVRWTLMKLNQNSGSNLYGKQIGNVGLDHSYFSTKRIVWVLNGSVLLLVNFEYKSAYYRKTAAFHLLPVAMLLNTVHPITDKNILTQHKIRKIFG